MENKNKIGEMKNKKSEERRVWKKKLRKKKELEKNFERRVEE